MTAVLFLHVAATLFMTGLSWFVLVVHYPLFARVGPDAFPRYHAGHVARTGRVVIPAMLVELGTGLALLARPAFSGDPVFLAAMGSLALVWLSTFFLQVPAHRVLGRAFDEGAWRRLTATHGIRTALWTARAFLILVLVPGMSGGGDG